MIRQRLADWIDQDRLWARHLAMASIGASGATGVNRPAFSEEDIRARWLLIEWARELELTVLCDGIGNLFLRYQPNGCSGAPVLTGSHMDSQPTGGRFDGIYGVLAGLEAVTALRASETPLRRPVDVVCWSNEEGSRFAPGAMGSMVFTGTRSLDAFLPTQDAAGVRLHEALKQTLDAMPAVRMCESGFPVAAYVEAHVEQGSILEQTGNTIGVVTSIQGCRWFEVEVAGEARHAGTTPMRLRKDALQSALRVVQALNEWCADPGDVLRFTIGRFETRPNSPNTVPDHVRFTIDLRHPDAALLDRFASRVPELAHSHAEPCAVTVKATFSRDPVVFPERITRHIADAAAELSLPDLRMPSGAFHDAMFLAGHCPAGMIFVPSVRGVSHHPDEYTSPADLAAGARVLVEVLQRLASE